MTVPKLFNGAWLHHGDPMEPSEIIRLINGLIKKHGQDFSLALKYRTDTNKVKKRHGEFVELKDELELRLRNPGKNTVGTYQLARIEAIKKR